jgi:SAM-dependent methyltransferase
MNAGHYGADFFEGYRGRFNQYWWARRFYASIIKRYGKPGKLLEVGCGLGHVLVRLQDDFETYGIDVSAYAIEQARKNTPRSTLSVAAAEEVGSLPGPFDDIAAFHVVEHLEDPAAVLRLCAESLVTDGRLIFATPNTDAPLAKRKGERWFARTDPTHISLKSAREWLALVREAGFRVRRTFSDGMWDVPYVPRIPAKLQLAVLGLPTILQTVTCVPFIPVRLGESVIVVAEKAD